ncbi:Small ubiquitin-related modifier 2 [Abeliophyllum distichum]|uniref:Small ubiquitin-related modifier 2 n=1 Tax=Abeliophyllum distichum TaxID=126358 RepID=A0ABD1PSR3_9LAMI
MSGVTQDEDKKPGDQSIHINLKVKGQDGSEVVFRIKRSTQLKKLMNAYCDRQSVDFNSIAFLFDGRRLRGEQTPDELEMEEGDEIDAMLHQTGDGPGDGSAGPSLSGGDEYHEIQPLWTTDSGPLHLQVDDH